MQILRKIKRIEPLITLKKTRVDEEAAILAKVRQEKLTVVQAMKENQRKYMRGVEELNQVRSSPGRVNQELIESGLDHIKSQWYRCYKDVQEIEHKEKAQIAQLLTAERELAAIERLREKYQSEFKKQSGKAEQKMLDEAALRQYVTRS